MFVATMVFIIVCIAALWAFISNVKLIRERRELQTKLLNEKQKWADQQLDHIRTLGRLADAERKAYQRGREDMLEERRMMLLRESGEVKQFSIQIAERELMVADSGDDLLKAARTMLTRNALTQLFEAGYGLRTNFSYEVRQRDLPDFGLSTRDYFLVATTSVVPLIAPLPPEELRGRNPTFDAGVDPIWYRSEPYSPSPPPTTSVGDEPRVGEKE